MRSRFFDPKLIHFLNEITIDEGILLFYSTIDPLFSLGLALLSKDDPTRILWIKDEPVWRTCEKIKPIKVSLDINQVNFYFKLGREKCFIDFPLEDLLQCKRRKNPAVFQRIKENPILQPIEEHHWESAYVFNPAAIMLDNKVHFIYRAIGESESSVFGYASSQDGIHIDERCSEPVFSHMNAPYHVHEKETPAYLSGGSCCGCEDPRLVKIHDTIYMTYTVVDGSSAPYMSLTSIQVNDFLNKFWSWSQPIRLSPMGEQHKNWVVFPDLLNNQYAILHSITPNLCIDYFESLDFEQSPVINSSHYSHGRHEYWDNWVRGVGPPPIKIDDGWLVLYHAMDHRDPNRYKLGGMILDKDEPTQILHRAKTPLLEPDEHYENQGFKSGVIYVCGAILMAEKIVVYYGGADSVICTASASLNDVLNQIKHG